MTDTNKTPLYPSHCDLGGKIVDFGGWLLPVNYGSQIEEHHAVRNNCGVFDVSHMTVSDVSGDQAHVFLRAILANDVQKLANKAGNGHALYSCLLNPEGGVLDDLIVYRLDETQYRIISNAGTRAKVIDWLNSQSHDYAVKVTEQPQLALIAVQGPNSAQAITQLGDPITECVNSLKRFQGAFVEHTFIGRTGYTGEDGFEIVAPAKQVTDLWQKLINNGVQPCGLGARDTLRLEAGMALYGNELDDTHTPIECGLKWTVDTGTERDFIGRAALTEKQKLKSIGLVLNQRGVLRSHQRVFLNDSEVGEITSGTYSPTLEKSIALARVLIDCEVNSGDTLEVEIRNKKMPVTVTKPPFIRR